MLTADSPMFLRRVLLLDAATSFLAGALLVVLADVLAPLFGLPSVLLVEAGIVLLPFAALVAYVGTRASISPRWVWVVILCNAMWVVDSIMLLLSAWVAPTLAGEIFVVAQAVAVAVLAELEYAGLRKSVVVAA